MTEATDFIIDGQSIAKGERCTIDLALPKLYTHTRLHMPLQVVRGRKEGPCLFVSAAIHGDEINGVEIIRRLLAMPVLKQLRGTLIAVPVVNVFGLIAQSRYLPDRRDLNRCFPGSEKGSLAALIANTFMQHVVAHADVGIDLHTGAIHRTNLPQIRADLSDPETARLTNAFGAPVALDSQPIEGTLRHANAENSAIPLLLYEAGEALRFDELAIRAGVRGIIAVMRAMDMLAKKPKKRVFEPVISRRSSWMRASQSGIMRVSKTLGSRVKKGDVLAIVSDPFGEQESPVIARFSGIVIGCTNLPLVNQGEALFHIAWVSKPGELEDQVEAYHEELSGIPELADTTIERIELDH